MTKKTTVLFSVVAAIVVLYALSYGQIMKTDFIMKQQSAISSTVSTLLDTYHGMVGERVVNLPEDGRTWCAVFVWPDNKYADANSRQLSSFFGTTPRLQSLLAQTKTFEYTPDDRLYQTRYKDAFGGETPQFWLIRPEENPSLGRTIYKVSGSNLPVSGEAMANEICAMISDYCPQPNPRPGPQPQPFPGPQPFPNPNPIPDIRPPEPEPVPSELPVWAIIIPLLAGLAGAYVEYKRSK
jgi:hypothetical protein